MAQKWHKSKFPGVMFRKHPTRKHGVAFDRYFVIYYRFDGRNFQEALGWGSKRMTAEKANEILAELKQNQRTGQAPKTLKEKRAIAKATEEARKRDEEKHNRQSLTLDMFFNETYLPQTKADKKSWKRDEQLYRIHMKGILGDLPIFVISPLDVERVKRKMSRGGSKPRTVAYALAVLRRTLNVARNYGILVDENPVSKVKIPSTDNRRRRFLSYEEAENLLAKLKKSSHETYTMTLISLHCGLRFGEIAGLTHGDLDFEQENIFVRDPKNTENRFAFMTEQVKSELKDLPDGKRVELLFPARGGDPMKSKAEVSNFFQRTVDNLGLNDGVEDSRDKVVFHTCRHTFASWHAMNGTDMYTLQQLMGQKTAEMVRRYSHLSPTHLKKAMDNFEKSMPRHQTSGGDIVPLMANRKE